MQLKRGDKVTYSQMGGVVLTVISDPYDWNYRTVVTCKWLPAGRKKEYEYAMFDVKGLTRVEQDDKHA